MLSRYSTKMLIFTLIVVLESCGVSPLTSTPAVTLSGSGIGLSQPNTPDAAKNRIYLPTETSKSTGTPFHQPASKPAQPPEKPKDIGGYYVAPNGSPSGDGSIDNPWDLETAFNHPSEVQPGDTIYLRGGTYGTGGDTGFKSKLTSEADLPITIRPYPGEHVVINGTINVYGSGNTFIGLELLNSSNKRQTNSSGSIPPDILQGDGFNVFGSNTKIINNVIHDQAGGIGVAGFAQNVEFYGNVIYNIGWQGPDRGHGHGIYAQNEAQDNPKIIRENIVFNTFSSYTTHVYGEEPELLGFLFEGNVNFNGQFLVGGLQRAGGVTLKDNFFFRNKLRLGYRNENNLNATVQGNYFAADNSISVEIKWWENLDFSGNTIWNKAEKDVSLVFPASQGSYYWDKNQYFASSKRAFMIDEAATSWTQWKNKTGFDSASTFTTGAPTGVDSFVRPNEFEPKQANIIIYNWDLANMVQVDISSLGFALGEKYVLHNVQNYFEETVEGTYDGNPISIPMTGWTITTPIGWGQSLQPVTFPQFGAFVITPVE